MNSFLIHRKDSLAIAARFFVLFLQLRYQILNIFVKNGLHNSSDISVPMVDPRNEIMNHLGPMRAFALSLTHNGSAADDLVQDTLVKAWSKFGHFKPGTQLQAWLFTILRNTFYSDCRKAKREVHDVDGAFAATLSVKPSHDGRLAMSDFLAAFARLSVEQREALTLVGAAGYSYEEAARTCGVAAGTIKSRVNRARAQLVDLLQMSADDTLEMTDKVTMSIVNTASAPQWLSR